MTTEHQGEPNKVGHLSLVFYGYRWPLTLEVGSRFDHIQDVDKERVMRVGFNGCSLLICPATQTNLPGVFLEKHEIEQGFVLKSEIHRVCEDMLDEEKDNFFFVSEEDKTALSAVVVAMGLELEQLPQEMMQEMIPQSQTLVSFLLKHRCLPPPKVKLIRLDHVLRLSTSFLSES